MAYIKSKSSTQGRIDFLKKMGHQLNGIVDFIRNECTYVIKKYQKWNTQTGVRIGLIAEMICTCNEFIFWMMCYLLMTNIIILIILFFMALTNGNVCCIYIEESDMFFILPQQRGLDVNLDAIDLAKCLNNLRVAVHHAVPKQFCGFLINFEPSKTGLIRMKFIFIKIRFTNTA